MRDKEKNWVINEERFNLFEGNFDILRYCTQMLFSNQQLISNAISALLQQYVQMYSVPNESSPAILKYVAADHSLSGSRLSLAIPPTE